MISIIYPFRNRELSRIKNSLDSLVIQTSKDFKVIFVDYGSKVQISNEVKELLKQYEFVNYIYSYNEYQPWSRSKAINIGLRNVTTEYVFISDIDILFHHRFIELLNEVKSPKKSIYFQVGYLSESESKTIKEFDCYKIESKSIKEGQGLSLFFLESLIAVNGFDEFFHFWGSEDEDIHSRLSNLGLSTEFFNEKIYLLHQWHKLFKDTNSNKLTTELKFLRAFNFNRQKLRFNQNNNLIKVNNDDWGKIFEKKDIDVVQLDSNAQKISNKKDDIHHFLEIILPNTNSKVVSVKFVQSNVPNSMRYRIKRMLGIEVSEYYTLKEINDLILMHLIIYYNKYPYSFRVNSDKTNIEFCIKK